MSLEETSRSAPSRLVCHESFFDGAVEHGLRSAPQEACGVVLGRRRLAIVRLCELAVLRNSAPFEPHLPAGRFAMSPLELARYLVPRPSAAHVRSELVGFWHSHPHGSPELSAVDLRAAWPGYVHIVVALRSEAVGARGTGQGSPLTRGSAGAEIHAYWCAHGRVTALRVEERAGRQRARANSKAPSA